MFFHSRQKLRSTFTTLILSVSFSITYRALEPALFCLEIHESNHSTARRLRSHRDSFRSDIKRFYSDHPTASPTERPTTHPTDGTQLDVVVDDDRDTNGSRNAGDGETEDTFDVGSDVGSRVGSEVGSDVGLAVGFARSDQ